MNEEKPQPQKAVKLEIKIDDPIAAGIYSNLCLVNHSDSEFVMDFVFVQPGRAKTKVASRIILSPKNAKRVMLLLEQQVKAFEQQFGELKITPPIPMKPSSQEIN